MKASRLNFQKGTFTFSLIGKAMVINREYLLPIFRESCMPNRYEKRVAYINDRCKYSGLVLD